MNDDFSVRPASVAEFKTAVEWAAAEGWNPGLDDIEAFHAADPEGFLMGFMGDTPVSSIAVVRYDDAFGFLGFYIAHPLYRHQGVGWRTWKAGMAHLGGRTIGLDGVVAQQENYRRSGFALAGRNIRYTTRFDMSPKVPAMSDIELVTAFDRDTVKQYDRMAFPASRDVFLDHWLVNDGAVRRQTLYAVRDGALSGYGTIRACRVGYKIGPLFATDRHIAEALFAGLVNTIESGSEVILDVPEQNLPAVALAESLGMKPVFETARMYRGKKPEFMLERNFGVTSFELG